MFDASNKLCQSIEKFIKNKVFFLKNLDQSLSYLIDLGKEEFKKIFGAKGNLPPLYWFFVIPLKSQIFQ